MTYTPPMCDSALPLDERNTSTSSYAALQGLLQYPRTLPPHLFYDAQGARLFEEITRLDEYYLTRTERSILTTYASEIADVLGRHGVVLEYGSGAANKIRLLLDVMAPTTYVPIDVSEEQLLYAADQLATDHPAIAVRPVVADFTAPFALPPDLPAERRVALFLGSTIGNFHLKEARVFLHRVAQQVGRNGLLLLGVDLRKAPAILHAAYNDSRGVTAAFNRNILEHIRREFHVCVRPQAFAHYAFYNPVAGRVEMHLIATEETDLRFGSHQLKFAPGEGIWTESSYKYTIAELTQLAKQAGLAVDRLWTDPKQWFAVVALRPV